MSNEELNLIIRTLRSLFKYIDKNGKEKEFRPNHRIATVLLLQANLGLHIGNVLALRLNIVLLKTVIGIEWILQSKKRVKR